VKMVVGEGKTTFHAQRCSLYYCRPHGVFNFSNNSIFGRNRQLMEKARSSDISGQDATMSCPLVKKYVSTCALSGCGVFIAVSSLYY